MDYARFYDYVDEELRAFEARVQQMDIVDDYRDFKALAACIELREYLANRIAQDPDFDEYYDLEENTVRLGE